ncbi:MAG: hypothetical protein MN733_25020 [Nitrososphaera sp.]|nr:hypothetical protein [Nitrososphaera sp.]
MAFTVQDYTDLVRLLNEHPEWRADLRRLILSDELLTLPEIVRELAEAQRRTEEQVRVLTEAQHRAEEHLGRLESIVEALVEQVRALAEAQQRNEERLSRLGSIIEILVEQVRALTEAQQRTERTVGDLKGDMLELTYQNKAGAYFGPLLRRLQVVKPYTLEDRLEVHLSEEEFKDVLLLDLLVSGRPRHHPDIPEVWLAIEVSAVIDQEDVDRARRRAELLGRAGYQAIPAVAGKQATLGAESEARTHKVVLLQDGRIFLWEEALQAWTG